MFTFLLRLWRIWSRCRELNGEPSVVGPLHRVELDLSPHNWLFLSGKINLGQRETSDGDVGVLWSSDTVKVPVFHDVCAVMKAGEAVNPG